MPTPNADGPDTSHYQVYTGGPLPWALHSLKCSEGKKVGDLTFPARWQILRNLGVKYRGAYHWIRGDSSMADQAANLCARIDLTGGLRRGEFVQCDWEVTTNVANVTPAQVIDWCDRVEAHFGRACVVVYTSDWVPGFAEWRRLKPDYPLWFANYNLTDRSTGGWAECARYGADLWQWTSSYTHPSIVGRFDMNHVFDWATLDRVTDQVAAPIPTPIPPEDEMAHKVIVDYETPEGTPKGTFTLDGIPLDQAMIDALIGLGYKRVKSSHPYWRAGVEHRNGAHAATLYGGL